VSNALALLFERIEQNTLLMNTTAKVIVGFVVGAAIGSLTSLLLAPSTGKTTRKNLNKKAKKLVKQLQGALGQQPVGKQRKKTSPVTSHLKNGRAQVTY
jgi:gas vesicle protein